MQRRRVNVVMRGETGTDGVLELRNLEVGKRYYMKETKAPEGNPVSQLICLEIHWCMNCG